MLYLDDNLLVFTDLDGSLLDHHSYQWQAAQPWLDKLKQHNVPVIITTSKTAAEVNDLQSKLALIPYPFIAENGAMIQLPPQWPDTRELKAGYIIGRRYKDIRQVLVNLRQRFDFKFRGFGDVSPQQVMEWTGLEPENAALAMRRQGSEPLIWFGNRLDFKHFAQCLQQEQLKLVRGGRFWHVIGKKAGKGPAVNWLSQYYQQLTGRQTVSIGLGDGTNDLGMLSTTNFAVVIKGQHKNPMLLDTEHQVYRTHNYGPAGWKEGLDHFIQC